MTDRRSVSKIKSNRPRCTEVAGLAAMVGRGDVFGVGGHHFARLPIALLRAMAGSGSGICDMCAGPVACRLRCCSKRTR